MRRVVLVLVGAVGSVLMLVLLWGVAGRTIRMEDPRNRISMPYAVEQTTVRVLELRSYDGIFPEDGSNRPVNGVAALVLENTGSELLEKGAVKLQQGENLMVFSFSMLPAGAKVLVLEKSGKNFSSLPITGCWGWSVKGKAEERIRVEEAGRSSLAVTNLTNSTLDSVKIYFKAYDREADMYIGGFSYCLEVKQLRPGYRQVIPAYRYISGASRVVG